MAAGFGNIFLSNSVQIKEHGQSEWTRFAVMIPRPTLHPVSYIFSNPGNEFRRIYSKSD